MYPCSIRPATPIILYAGYCKAAIFISPTYRRRYALVYLALAVLLALCPALITRGPDLETAHGVTIQATGQKIIVYAAIVYMFIQDVGAREMVQSGAPGQQQTVRAG